MKIKTLLAAAVIASASTATFAGDVSNAGTAEQQIMIPAGPNASPSRIPPIVYPIALCLLLCGSLGSSGGS